MCWVTEIMFLAHTPAATIDGCIPITEVTGETQDISQYLDFGFYDKVWFKDNAGLSPAEPGRWLGISKSTGRLMTYHILTQQGTVVTRGTVQQVTELEMQLLEYKELFVKFDVEIHKRLRTKDRGYEGSKPSPQDWADLLEEDEDFAEEFKKSFNNMEIPEADEFTPEVLEDTYVNMEIALPRESDGPEFARVVKRRRDNHGMPIGVQNKNPILDTRIYDVEYIDGHKAALSANIIAQNMFAQVDEEGNRHVLLDEIIDFRTNGKEIRQQDAFIKSNNGAQRQKETTKGWELLIQWKDGSTIWESLKDMKDTYPVQVTEFSIHSRISKEPAFAWWVPFVLKKRKSIISKIKSKYWTRTHKYGMKIPKSVRQAYLFDTENHDTFWRDPINLEMKNVRAAFAEYEGEHNNTERDQEDLKRRGYQKVDCHMIFDIKLGENFRRKARMVAGGHQTVTPAALTYASVVSRDSVRIALMIAALNDLDILAADIQNAYLTAQCKEKIYTIAGPEFGSDEGKIFIIVRALYGLKSSGAAFRSLLAETLHDMGYVPSYADGDVWMRPGIKKNKQTYWEYVLVYVDDVLAISEHPKTTMQSIQSKFKLKGDKIEPPEMYLGALLSQFENEDGIKCWSMSSEKYCEAAVKNVEDELDKHGLKLPAKCTTPLSNGYRP